MPAEIVAEFLTPAEFAVAAGLSLATVRRRIREGSLPVFQPGGKRTAVRIPRSALLTPHPTLPGTADGGSRRVKSSTPHWLRRH